MVYSANGCIHCPRREKNRPGTQRQKITQVPFDYFISVSLVG